MLSKFNVSGWVGPAPRLEDNYTNAVNAGPTLAISVLCKILQCLQCLKLSRTNAHSSSRSGVNSGGRHFFCFEFLREISIPNRLQPCSAHHQPCTSKVQHPDNSASWASIQSRHIHRKGKERSNRHRISTSDPECEFVNPSNITKRHSPLFLRKTLPPTQEIKPIMIINPSGMSFAMPFLVSYDGLNKKKLPIKEL
ncbi:hypothetical protein CTA2_8875 [Colletotrichum tanaceti]|nr:hypothetical protein CTA2_8875 [Colletotrichum tanaceti]